jgi:hypothetical protein
VSAWAGVVITVCAVGWGAFRSQRKQDHFERLYAELAEAVTRAKLDAIKHGKRDPYPTWLPLGNASDDSER